jgi:predicted site-specific integrase-resolvase
MPVDPTRIKPELVYSVYEASQILEVGEQSIRQYLNDGTLKGRKSRNKRWRIPGNELLRFLGAKEEE